MTTLFQTGPSLLPRPNTEAEILFCNTEREAEKSAHSLIGRAILLGGGVFGANILADYFEWPHTYVTGATIAAALAYFLPLIQREKERVVQSSFQLLDVAQDKPPSPKTEYEIPFFPLPPNLGVLPQHVLDRAYPNEPLKYYRRGSRIGVSLDGSRLNPEAMSRILEILHLRYPQIRRITFCNADVSKLNLLQDLLKFKQLSRVTFQDCRNLKEEDLNHMMRTLRQLRCLDLQSPVKLSVGFCERWERDHLVMYHDGQSNKRELFQDFYHDLTNLCKRQLLTAANEMKGDREKGPLFIELIRLLQMEAPEDPIEARQRKEGIQKMLEAVRSIFTPRTLSLEVKQQLAAQAVSFIRQLPRKNYYAVMSSSMSLNMSSLFLDDDLFGPILEGLQKVHSHITGLDLSGTFVSGNCLQVGVGLPIQTLRLCDLAHLDNDALAHLISYPELSSLDLSGSVVNPSGLLRGIRTLPVLRELILNRCAHITSPALAATVYALMDTLEFLSIEGSPVHRNTVHRMIERGNEDISKPFIVVWTDTGTGRVDVSACRGVDNRLFPYLMRLAADEPIRHLSFGCGTRLTSLDIDRLLSLDHFTLRFLDFTGCEMEPSAMARLLRKWPLESIKFGHFEATLDHFVPGNEPTVRKITIQAPEGLSPDVFQFLGMFKEVQEVSLTGCPHLTIDQFRDLSGLCPEKKIKKIDLSHTDITNDFFEDVAGDVHPFIRSLFCQVEHLNCSNTRVDQHLLEQWEWDMACPNPYVVVTLGSGAPKTFSGEHHE